MLPPVARPSPARWPPSTPSRSGAGSCAFASREIGGAVVEGPLLSAANGHLAVRGPDGAVVDFAPEDIGTLAMARPRRGREWALASVGIVAGTAIVGGLVSLPVVGDYLRASSQYAFVAVFYAGAGSSWSCSPRPGCASG